MIFFHESATNLLNNNFQKYEKLNGHIGILYINQENSTVPQNLKRR